MGYIYKITNIINNKAYVGQTRKDDPYKRWKGHLSAIKYNNGCPILTAAFKKHGVENFKFEIIIICFDEDLCKYEKEYVKKYNTLAPDGYNAVDGGEMGGMFKGKHHSDKTKAILREKSTNFYNNNPDVKKQNIEKIKLSIKMSEKWKKAVEEGKAYQNRKGHIGHKVNAETKDKISNGLKKYYAENKELNKHINVGRPGRQVRQFDKDGNFIKEYKSITEGEKETGITRRNIQNSLSGYSKTAGGFIWKYVDK
jgi:group I intron endonuclease